MISLAYLESTRSVFERLLDGLVLSVATKGHERVVETRVSGVRFESLREREVSLVVILHCQCDSSQEVETRRVRLLDANHGHDVVLRGAKVFGAHIRCATELVQFKQLIRCILELSNRRCQIFNRRDVLALEKSISSAKRGFPFRMVNEGHLQVQITAYVLIGILSLEEIPERLGFFVNKLVGVQIDLSHEIVRRTARIRHLQRYLLEGGIKIAKRRSMNSKQARESGFRGLEVHFR